jgi:hypothetical protein
MEFSDSLIFSNSNAGSGMEAVRILIMDGPGEGALELAGALAAGLGLPLVAAPPAGGAALPPAWVALGAAASAAEAAALDAALAAAGGAPQLVLCLVAGGVPLSRRLLDPASLEPPAAARFAADGRWRRLQPEGGTVAGLAVARRMLQDWQASRRPPPAAAVIPEAGPGPGPAAGTPVAGAPAPAAPPAGSWKATAERRGRLVRRPAGTGPGRRGPGR